MQIQQEISKVYTRVEKMMQEKQSCQMTRYTWAQTNGKLDSDFIIKAQNEITTPYQTHYDHFIVQIYVN